MRIIPDEDFIWWFCQIFIMLKTYFIAPNLSSSERSYIVSSLFTNNRQKEGGGKGGWGGANAKRFK